MLGRTTLLDTLLDNLGVDLIPDRRLLHVHVRSDRNDGAQEALEVDASAFSSVIAGLHETERWRTGLLEPLVATANWARKNGLNRILLSGSYRLSTAFLLGWAFRSAIGFEIDIPTKSGIWATDLHPAAGGTAPGWSIQTPAALIGDRLIVGIGVLRDPAADIVRSLGQADRQNILLANLPQALSDGIDAQASVQIVKAAISQAAARLRPAAVDLYYVGPAALAVAFGHRWNGLPPTQLHEFAPVDGRYVRTAFLA